MSTKRLKILRARVWIARLLKTALHPRSVQQLREAREKLEKSICRGACALAIQDAHLRDT